MFVQTRMYYAKNLLIAAWIMFLLATYLSQNMCKHLELLGRWLGAW